jgi:hypothetical protein
MRPRETWEDEVTTTQRPHRTPTHRAPCRSYSIPLQLCYKAKTKNGFLYGFGQIRMMSSKEIIFGGNSGLRPGMKAEVAVAWPRLLNGQVPLQLVLEATITSSQDGVTEARILAYDFRTRRVGGSGADN